METQSHPKHSKSCLLIIVSQRHSYSTYTGLIIAAWSLCIFQVINQTVSEELTKAGFKQSGLYVKMCADLWGLFNTRYVVKQEELPQFKAVSLNNIDNFMHPRV